jgi:hypothetical protein
VAIVWRGRHRALGRYWNALVLGAPPWELGRLSEAVDPGIVDAVLRLRALDDASPPDPAFLAACAGRLVAPPALPGGHESRRVAAPEEGGAAHGAAPVDLRTRGP